MFFTVSFVGFLCMIIHYIILHKYENSDGILFKVVWTYPKKTNRCANEVRKLNQITWSSIKRRVSPKQTLNEFMNLYNEIY